METTKVALKQSEIKRARAIQQIEAVQDAAKSAHLMVTAKQCLTAEEFYNLRNAARKAGVYIKVLRNRLASRALEGTQFTCLQSALKGPILLAFSMKEPNSAARLLRDFSKKHENLVVQHLAFEGQLLEAQHLGTMADLPTREEAIARLLAVLQAPLRKMLYVLSEPPAKFVRVLSAMKDR